jgi:hypothetical protein
MKRTIITALVLFVLASAIFISGCATVSRRQVTNREDMEFIRSVWEESLDFDLPAGDASLLAWNRAQVYVAKYGTSLNMVQDFLIQSSFPPYPKSSDGIILVRYAVTRLNYKDKTEFSVSAFSSGASTAATLNGKMLVRYMKTGELRPHLLSQDFDMGQIINPTQY